MYCTIKALYFLFTFLVELICVPFDHYVHYVHSNPGLWPSLGQQQQGVEVTVTSQSVTSLFFINQQTGSECELILYNH